MPCERVTVRAFLVLYIAIYAAYGVASPFLPAFLLARGLPAEHLGLLLGVGIGVRMLSAPVAGRMGDATHAHRLVLGLCAALSALVALAYLGARGPWALVAVSVVDYAALAPIGSLADALALSASASEKESGRGFEYGWVRGAGSAAFVVGVLCSGQAVKALGLGAIVVEQAILLVFAAAAAGFIPDRTGQRARDPANAGARASAVLTLLRAPLFVRVILVAALVLGSHAMHDGFAVIWWRESGIDPAVVSVLWSESVVAEVLVFFVVGPRLLARFSPPFALAVAAIAGVVRWTVAALTSHVGALALVQPLHGLTFALLHLSCMRMFQFIVPQGLEATAQAIYGTVAVGGATALLSFASGALYARFEAHGFFAMAALCAASLPVTWTLRRAPSRAA